MLHYLFSNLDKFSLGVWLVFFLVVLGRMGKPAIFKNLSYRWFIVLAVLLHLVYGAIATWGQYVRWGEGSDLTRSLLVSPLSPDVPLATFFSWLRPSLSGSHGYFAHYAFQHFFLESIALFVITALFLVFLFARAYFRPINFRDGDIAVVVLSLLISGWPGVVVLVPVALLVAVLFSILARLLYGIERLTLPPAFLVASPIALLYSIPILTFFHLYPLLKL